MAFAKFDPNNKPAAGNEWQQLPDGGYRTKLSDDCKPFDCEVVVLEATSYMKYQQGDSSTYEHLVLNLGLIKNGQLSDVYHRVDIKGGKVVNGVANITNRIYNIFAIATAQKPDSTNVIGQCTKYDYNKNAQTHDVLNMTGVKFRVLIATTGQYNGHNTYTTYFYAPSKQSYEEMIANDLSLTAFNKGVEDITKKRTEYQNGQQGGYGTGYGTQQQQQGYGGQQQQQFNNFAGGQNFGNAQPQQTQTMQAVNSMQSLQGVATQQPATALDDDLPF